MGRARREMIGKLYTVKTYAQCNKEKIPYVRMPTGVAGNIVVVVSNPNLHKNTIRYARVTTSLRGTFTYYPIAPTPKRPLTTQLNLRDYTDRIGGRPSMLPEGSCLRMEELDVPVNMLAELKGDNGEHVMLSYRSMNKVVKVLETMRKEKASKEEADPHAEWRKAKKTEV